MSTPAPRFSARPFAITVVFATLALACHPATVQSPARGSTGSAGASGSSGSGASGSAAGGGSGLSIPDAGPNAAQPPATGTCAMDVHRAERLPVDSVLLVDASQSMDELAGSDSKWNESRAALSAFVNDPGSAGLGVGVAFFPGASATGPLPKCAADADCAGFSDPVARSCHKRGVCYAAGLPILDRLCAPGLVSPFNCPAGMDCVARGVCPDGAVCAAGMTCAGGGACPADAGECLPTQHLCDVRAFGQLDVDVASLPGNGSAILTAFMNHQPDGGTPMTRAVGSAYMALATRAVMHPDRRVAVVLATDGLPSACGPDESVENTEARILAARSATPSIPTYVIGVFAPDEIAKSQDALGRFAVAGGTRSPFILEAGQDVTGKLLDALKEIRGLTVSCDYAIPTQTGGLDFGKVNVRTTSAGASADLGYVESADRCSPDKGGWYYEPALTMPMTMTGAAPDRVVLCPQSCDRVRTDAASEVDIVYGCATRRID